MKVKVSVAKGAALDWMVEVANGTCWVNGYFCYQHGDPDFKYPFTSKTRPYSSHWSHGGPIIEREGIALYSLPGARRFKASWQARKVTTQHYQHTLNGSTSLIAAMRCYVVSKLGEEVDVPEALLSTKGNNHD